MVVIDQQFAFVGGIDLCFMRYEDDDFTLLDFDGVKFPGILPQHSYKNEMQTFHFV